MDVMHVALKKRIWLLLWMIRSGISLMVFVFTVLKIRFYRPYEKIFFKKLIVRCD